MSKRLFMRTAATSAAVVAIGLAGSMSLSGANAATTHPAVTQSVQVAQVNHHSGYWCGRYPWLHWCYYPRFPEFPRFRDHGFPYDHNRGGFPYDHNRGGFPGPHRPFPGPYPHPHPGGPNRGL